MSDAPFVVGTNDKAPFTLKVHRGNGMALLAMNWKGDTPPPDFVGFAVEYREPSQDRFHALHNRIRFDDDAHPAKGRTTSSLQAPIQKFRWIHCPYDHHEAGDYQYRVTPVFMNENDELSQGEPQEASLGIGDETIPGAMAVSFTRGFISSQAFTDRYASTQEQMNTLLPTSAKDSWDFKPTHPHAKEALDWMGYEAWRNIQGLLDEAIADEQAQICMVAYDFNLPAIADRLLKLGSRLRIIVDDSKEKKGKPSHHDADSSESILIAKIAEVAGADHVKRQHMGGLQHNKTIIVNGPKVKAAVCGSTNFAWRGMFVQNNHAVIVRGQKAIKPFLDAFEGYWNSDGPSDFQGTPSTGWTSLGLKGVKGHVTFSPHTDDGAVLPELAESVAKAKSSVFYSLAFLPISKGKLRDAITAAIESQLFVYGVSDRRMGGLDLQQASGNVAPVSPQNLTSDDTPEPFKSELTGLAGNVGTRMHHKFVVIDFNTKDACVYFGSNNMSEAADLHNGENLLRVRDRRVATAFMIEALRIIDHYEFRVAALAAEKSKKGKIKRVALQKPPREKGELPWWHDHYTVAHRIHDRELFS